MCYWFQRALFFMIEIILEIHLWIVFCRVNIKNMNCEAQDKFFGFSLKELDDSENVLSEMNSFVKNPFFCEVDNCEKRFQTSKDLEAHEEEKHDIYLCEYCLRKFHSILLYAFDYYKCVEKQKKKKLKLRDKSSEMELLDQVASTSKESENEEEESNELTISTQNSQNVTMSFKKRLMNRFQQTNEEK